MNITFLILPIAILILTLIYLIFFAGRILNSLFNLSKRNSYFLASAVVIGLSAAGFLLFGFVTVIVILHLLLFAAVMQLIHFFVCRKSATGTFDRIYKLGIIPVILTAAVLTAGYFNMISVTDTRYELTTDKLSSDESLRIAMVSDLHLGTALDSDDVADLTDDINAENPDILVLPGDIVDEDTPNGEMEKAFAAIGKIKTRYCIYFVYGNHDKSTYGGNPHFTEADLESVMVENGINVLKDETVTFGNTAVVGRMDASGNISGQQREALEILITSDISDKYIIDLDHQPTDTESARACGVDLQLSGHTHGGQIFPAGLLNGVFHFNDVEYGLVSDGSYNIIVSSGISGWGFPIRTEKRSEYVIIDIKGK